MPSNTRLHTELLITAGVRGLDRIDAVIEALRAAGHNTDQLTDESARLRAEWDSLDPEERARRLRNLAEATNQAREDADRLADSAERNVGAFDRLKGAVIAFGAALGVAFVAGKIKDFFGEAVSGAADFEAQLSTVKAVSGASAEEMEALRAAAEKMGAETKYNATEAAQALENLARAGLKSSEAIEALPSVLALAQGNGLELADAASYITQTASGMGLAMSDAARVADVLAKAASSANTDIQGMGLAMSYAAPNAHALGLTLEETAAYIGKLADAGFDGSRAGTAMATMMSQFQNPASTFRRELASIGIRTNDFSQAIRELAATGPKGQAAISALGEAAGPAFRALVGQGIEAVDELNNKLKDATGFATKQAKEMGDNVGGAFAELESAWDAVKLKLATPILEPLKKKMLELADVISELVASGKIEDLGKKIADTFEHGADVVIRFVKELDFGAAVDKVSNGFAVLQTTGVALNGAFQALSIGLNGLKAGFAAIGIVLTTVMQVAANVALGILGAGEAVSDFFGITDSASNSMLERLSSLNEVANNARGALLEVINNAGESIRASGESIAGTAQDAAEKASTSLAQIPQATADAVEAAKQPILGFAQVAIDAAREVTDTAITEADKQTKAAVDAAQQTKTAQEQAAEAAKNAFADIGVDLDEVFTGVSAKSKKAMSDYTYAVQQAMDAGLDATAAARAGFEALAAKISSPEEWAALKQQLTDSGVAMDKLTQGQLKRMADGIQGLPDAAATAMDALKERLNSADLGGLERIGTEAKAAFAAGELSAKQYADILDQIKSKTEELRAKTAKIGETAAQAHGQAAQAAQEHAAAQKKETEASEQAAEATEKKKKALITIYDASKLNAEAIGLVDDAINSMVTSLGHMDADDYLRKVAAMSQVGQQYVADVQRAEKATELLNQRTSDGTVSMQDIARAAQAAHSNIAALDSTTLKKLNASIDAAKKRLEDLQQQAKDTAADLDAELAQLKGDDSKTAKLEQQRKLRELEGKLQEARIRGNAEEIRQYERALELQRQIGVEKARQAADKKAEAAARAQESRSRGNATSRSTTTSSATSHGAGDISPQQVVDALDDRTRGILKNEGAQEFARQLLNEAKRSPR